MPAFEQHLDVKVVAVPTIDASPQVFAPYVRPAEIQYDRVMGRYREIDLADGVVLSDLDDGDTGVMRIHHS